MIYLQLFWAFFQVGLVSFGGGYATLMPIQNQAVNIYQWLTLGEFTDLITISQMTPGPIALNSATFIGLRVAGIGGAIVATIGSILPSIIIVTFLGFIYFRFSTLTYVQGVLEGLRPAVVALIASAGAVILLTALWGGRVIVFPETDYYNLAFFLLAFFLLRRFKLDPVKTLVIVGVLGVALNLVLQM